MITLQQLHARFAAYPDLTCKLTLPGLVHFIVYAAALKADIALTQSSKYLPAQPPKHLPSAIQQFLAQVIQSTVVTVQECWSILRDVVWDQELTETLTKDLKGDFCAYGHAMGLSMCHLHIL